MQQVDTVFKLINGSGDAVNLALIALASGFITALFSALTTVFTHYSTKKDTDELKRAANAQQLATKSNDKVNEELKVLATENSKVVDTIHTAVNSSYERLEVQNQELKAINEGLRGVIEGMKLKDVEKK